MRSLPRCCEFALVVCILILFIVPKLIAQSYCEPAGDIANELKHRQPGNDGKIHATYSFSDANISQTSKSAIENAINQWNGQSSTTNIVFELAPAGTSGDVEFRPSTNEQETGGCASHEAGTNQIAYTTTTQSSQACVSGRTQTTTDFPNPTSFMRWHRWASSRFRLTTKNPGGAIDTGTSSAIAPRLMTRGIHTSAGGRGMFSR